MILKTLNGDRSKIVLELEDQIKHWIRHLDVTREELARGGKSGQLCSRST
jgi:hypothetical protein